MDNSLPVSISKYIAHDPFGMLLVGRNWEGGSEYRYGFNGKESDKETYGDGNVYDCGFRIYNPRLGKFLSVDPLAKSFPWNATYSFAENQPIWAIDLDGLERKIIITRTYSYYSETGAYQTVVTKSELIPTSSGPLGDGTLNINVLENESFKTFADLNGVQHFDGDYSISTTTEYVAKNVDGTDGTATILSETTEIGKPFNPPAIYDWNNMAINEVLNSIAILNFPNSGGIVGTSKDSKNAHDDNRKGSGVMMELSGLINYIKGANVFNPTITGANESWGETLDWLSTEVEYIENIKDLNSDRENSSSSGVPVDTVCSGCGNQVEHQGYPQITIDKEGNTVDTLNINDK